jgi:hypothetical protein
LQLRGQSGRLLQAKGALHQLHQHHRIRIGVATADATCGSLPQRLLCKHPNQSLSQLEDYISLEQQTKNFNELYVAEEIEIKPFPDLVKA